MAFILVGADRLARWPAGVCAWFLAAAVAIPAPVGAQDSTPNALALLSATLESAVRQGGGATAVVVLDGRIVWAEAFGWSDAERVVPARIETIYPLGSFSSAFTLTVVLQLAERGVLNLDDPAVEYLPELREVRGPPGYTESITLRELAQHTAGLVETPALPYAIPGAGDAWEAWLVGLIRGTPLFYVPGEGYGYSGLGVGMLGLAAARAVGRRLDATVETLVFEPLGLAQTAFEVDPAMRDLVATGRGELRDPALVVGPDVGPARVPAGVPPSAGIYSTAEDVARFLAGLVGDAPFPLLTAGALAALPGVRPEGGDPAYLPDGLWLDHGWLVGMGRTPGGHRVTAAADPETRLGVVVLQNLVSAPDGVEPAVHEALAALSEAARAGWGGDTGSAAAGPVALGDLDVRPVRRSCPEVRYPAVAGPDPRTPVTVTVELVLDREGTPEAGSIRVVSAQDTRFGDAAMTWAGACRYSPGSVSGHPVRVVLRQRITFRP